jgi:peptidyl-prolyl cis-trans isomerase C
MKILRLAALAVTLMGPLIVVPAEDKPAAKDPDEVWARGKGIEIKRSDVEEILRRIEMEQVNQGRLLPEDKRTHFEARVLEQLIFTKLTLALATDEDRKKGQENAAKFIKELRDRAPTDSAYRRQLARAGFNEETFTRQKVDEATVVAVVDRELKSKITVPDADVKKYYDENQERFERPDIVKVAHLLISTRDPATGQDLTEEQKKEKKRVVEDLLAKAKRGDDFSMLVKQRSEDPATRNTGGEMVITHGQTVVEFEAAAFALRPGQLSDVVTTQFGYHIIKCLENKSAEKRALADVEKDIRELLATRELQKQVPDWTAKLKKDGGIELTATAPKLEEPSATPAPK